MSKKEALASFKSEESGFDERKALFGKEGKAKILSVKAKHESLHTLLFFF
jgi:hypothetical protein